MHFDSASIVCLHRFPALLASHRHPSCPACSPSISREIAAHFPPDDLLRPSQGQPVADHVAGVRHQAQGDEALPALPVGSQPPLGLPGAAFDPPGDPGHPPEGEAGAAHAAGGAHHPPEGRGERPRAAVGPGEARCRHGQDSAPRGAEPGSPDEEADQGPAEGCTGVWESSNLITGQQAGWRNGLSEADQTTTAAEEPAADLTGGGRGEEPVRVIWGRARGRAELRPIAHEEHQQGGGEQPSWHLHTGPSSPATPTLTAQA